MNDNVINIDQNTNHISNIDELSDEDCLKMFLSFLAERVEVTTAFVKDEDTDVYTHQVIKIICGDYATVSRPEPLEMPLRPATGGELNATVQ